MKHTRTRYPEFVPQGTLRTLYTSVLFGTFGIFSVTLSTGGCSVPPPYFMIFKGCLWFLLFLDIYTGGDSQPLFFEICIGGAPHLPLPPSMGGFALFCDHGGCTRGVQGGCLTPPFLVFIFSEGLSTPPFFRGFYSFLIYI